MKCQLNGECEINVSTRHICSSCRLSKCFRKGMQIERIRRSTSSFPTINLLNNDNSTLDDHQWTLLSNLIHNYDETDSLTISQQLQIENRCIDSVLLINQNLVANLLKSFYRNAGKCIRSNGDISHLTSDDRSILIHTAIDNITAISAIFFFIHFHLIDDEILWMYLQNIYGTTLMEYHRWAPQFTLLDPILFKLSMNLFALSKHTRILYQNISSEYRNLGEIVKIENKYVELTWKYLVYKLGFDQSIRIFDKIIRWFLSLTVFMSYTHRLQTHVNDIQSLVQQTEMLLAFDDIDRIVKNN